MRHGVDGRKFGRNTSHRIAMFKNMANSVIEKEQMVTTVQKAKEVRRVVDRLITLGKSGNAASRRVAFDRTRNEFVVKKLFGELAERYKNRAGGYTRVLKLSDRRWGDAAEMAVIELVDHPELDRKKKSKAISAQSESDHEKTAQAPVDPFSRFRKMMGKSASSQKGKKAASTPKEAKAKKSVEVKAEESEKKSAGKKTAAKKVTAKKVTKKS